MDYQALFTAALGLTPPWEVFGRYIFRKRKPAGYMGGLSRRRHFYLPLL